MEPTLAELRAKRAAANIRQGVIAKRMGMTDGELSAILNERQRTPEGFPERFHAALLSLIREKANEERAAGEAKARALLEAAGLTDETPAPVQPVAA